MMESLLGKTLDELKTLVSALDMPGFTAGQIANWLYRKRIASIDEMSDISLAHRSRLKEACETGRRQPARKQESADGTVKYLFPVSGNRFIESVYIPDKDRATLCVSSQAGCKLSCLFCMTGKQGFSGQLTAGEMLNQVLSIPESGRLTNLVFMGMGEPLDNTGELFKAIELLTAGYGFAWSPKRITVSTVGIIPGLVRFLKELKVHLAVSLHSPFPDERRSLMPVEKAYPMTDILKLLRQYDFAHQRRLSFEYILFGGLNDDLKHATALAALLKGMPCRVNLIRYHAVPDVPLQASDAGAMSRFQEYLNSKGIICTIRASRGEDILAACGMLSGEARCLKDAQGDRGGTAAFIF
ncbi:MAG: 23S rRNA (adenine(2503)-C(2))-methyltransferase RlmN [Dysgonamonadaceae bacterium]|jgi:23S rRNA (adenine2503-C2)-methyltransferase|nr:23S rRNA (adenine(2503)-C(2))-methyltransferase RlmN [Dysgonamonadaceae bacterium]